MPKKKEFERSIPLKNYYIVAFIFICVIIIILYLFKWYEVKNIEKYRESYLVKTNTVNLEITEISEINQVLQETADNYFVYIGYRNNESVYNLEKKLEPIIKEHYLKDIFYYIDITSALNTNYKNDLNKSLNIKENLVENVPTIIYFKDKKHTIIYDKNEDKFIEKFLKLLKEEGYNKIAS